MCYPVRYCEIDKDSIKKENDKIVGTKVYQGEIIAKVGKMQPPVKLNNEGETTMVHIEYYSGEKQKDGTINYSNTVFTGTNKYKRRADIQYPLTILMEGYNNSFNQ